MRDIVLTAFYLFFLLSGLTAPFVFALGYIWVDLFSPQQLSNFILNEIPVSLIIGIAAVSGYLMFDRREPPRMVFGFWLILLWAAWISLTTLWAVVPEAAWQKWDWAIKTIVFAAFLPFVIRSRIQIEAMILTIVLSLAGSIMAGGIRTLLTGGGYQIKLGLLTGNSGLAEGSTLATTSVAVIPLLLFVRRHSLILPDGRLRRLFCSCLVVAALLTALGSFERTGIVALLLLLLCLWLQSRHKLAYGLLAVVAVPFALMAVSGLWLDRMATISDFRVEDSALTRLAVWLWTLRYAADHPLGGGFGLYLIDHIRVPIAETGEFLDVTGRAFHSIYFEVLGEQGIVGLGIFLAMLHWLFRTLGKVRRAAAESPSDGWLLGLASALTMSSIVYLAGGAFVGIAFQPLLYYWFACAITLQQLVARTEREASVSLIQDSSAPSVRPI